MGLLNKLKNVLFEEEEIEVPIEEPKKKVEQETKKPLERKRNVYESEIKDDTPIVSDRDLFSSEKTFDFPIFDDQEFESMKSPKKEAPEEKKSMGINLFDYEKPKIKRDVKERTPEIKGRAYDIKKPSGPNTKKFQPSPVISPVYGVLDKNYKKEDVVVVKEEKRTIDVDDVRKKAFGTLEEDIEKTLSETRKIEVPSIPETKEEKSVDELLEDVSFQTIDVPETKEEVKEIIPEELEIKEEPKKGADLENDTLENDLFDLIDSMYEDRKEEE